MLYSLEQLKAYGAARALLPELPTLADLHALKGSHAELVARVAELEARHQYMSGHTMETACEVCGKVTRNSLGDIMHLAVSFGIATGALPSDSKEGGA